MKIPALKAENVQNLRQLVKKVPVEIRDIARKERQNLIKMDKEMPGSSAYAIARGALNGNADLAKVVDVLNSKNAVNFYQRQPIGKIVNPKITPEEPRELHYVSASMIQDTANSQMKNDYMAKILNK